MLTSVRVATGVAAAARARWPAWRRPMARRSAQLSRRIKEQRWRQVQRRRQRRGFHDAAAAIREPRRPGGHRRRSCRGADAAVEIVEIRAAAQRDVLAVVDVLAAGQHVGRGAAAQIGAAVRANARGSRLQPARRPRKVPPGRRRSRSRSSRTSASDHQPRRARSRIRAFSRDDQAHARRRTRQNRGLRCARSSVL